MVSINCSVEFSMHVGGVLTIVGAVIFYRK